MDLNKHVLDFAYLLLSPRIGQKSLKILIKRFVLGNFNLKESPLSFKENLLSQNIQVIPYWSEKYPTILKEIQDSPPFLFAKGNLSFLEKMCVTIVGTRKIDSYGFKVLEDFFFNFKRELPSNICFVSGLANGVDSEVHRLCLKKNLPTIGVIAGGMDKKYYRGNSIMYEYLSRYGLVLSEFPPGRQYFKGMFPLRNRILAGLSSKTFVIQAGNVSGALNTASHANNYGRDVFVVPHNIYSEVGAGCLKLISEGAGSILNIDDFLDKVVN
jgi:DNA processing protein